MTFGLSFSDITNNRLGNGKGEDNRMDGSSFPMKHERPSRPFVWADYGIREGQ